MLKDKPRIEPTEKPTLLNDDAYIGAGIGSFVIAIPLAGIMLLTGFTPAIVGALSFAGGSLAGGLIGGSYGKARMEEDEKFGKEVKAPSYLNKGLFAGGAAGFLGGAAVLHSALFVAGLMGTSVISGVAALALAALPYAAGAIGAVAGSVATEVQMAKEYAQGIQQQTIRELEEQQKQRVKQAQHTLEQEETKSRNFAKMVEEQRAHQPGHGLA